MSSSPEPDLQKELSTGRSKDIAAVADRWLKSLTLVGIGLYGLGLLVTNSYLSTFSVSDFSLLKPQCMFTGVWAAFFIALAASPAFMFYQVSTVARQDSFFRRVIKKAFILAASVVAASLVAFLFRLFLGIGPNSYPTPSSGFMADAWAMTPPGWGTLLICMNFLAIFATFEVIGKRPDSSGFAVIMGSLLLSAVLGAVVVGNQMYPAVSRVIGGGRPDRVLVVLGKEGDGVISTIQAQTEPNYQAGEALQRNISGDLMYTNSDVFVLRINFCSTHKQEAEIIPVIDKKLISAYFPLNPLRLFPDPPTPLDCR